MRTLAILAALALGQLMPGGTPIVARYGHVSVGTSAAEIPPASVGGGTPNRTGVAVQNLGSNPIYCGWDTLVSVTNGWQVPPNAIASFLTPVWILAGTAVGNLYCLTGTGTSDIRWMEL